MGKPAVWFEKLLSLRRSHSCHEQWESVSDCANGSHAVSGWKVCRLCSSQHASARCCRRALYYLTVLGGDGGAGVCGGARNLQCDKLQFIRLQSIPSVHCEETPA